MDDEYLDNPKPCPFCGSAPCVMVNGKWNYIHCDACGADGPADLGLSGAITGWNKRSGEDDLRRQLEEARKWSKAWKRAARMWRLRASGALADRNYWHREWMAADNSVDELRARLAALERRP